MTPRNQYPYKNKCDSKEATNAATATRMAFPRLVMNLTI
jgi:hypothetical protein